LCALPPTFTSARSVASVFVLLYQYSK
jgi:hypothetical protein